MGMSNATLKLSNPRRPDIPTVDVDALADTGAVHLCVPQALLPRVPDRPFGEAQSVGEGLKRKVARDYVEEPFVPYLDVQALPSARIRSKYRREVSTPGRCRGRVPFGHVTPGP